MAEPFIFIGTHRVKPGRLEDFKDYFAKFCSNTVEPNEPRLLSFQGYGDDSDQITVAVPAASVATNGEAAAFGPFETTSASQGYPRGLRGVQK